jgi:CRISPR-associated protein (TIGR02710 family)
VAENPEDLVSCFRAARLCVDWLSGQGVPAADVLVDFTGGTKPMSAALALATIPLGCQLHYVGGDERNKSGVGQVVTGSEVLLPQENPWDIMALPQQQRAALLFNRCHFGAAKDVLAGALSMARTPRLRQYLEIAVPLMEFYAAWDAFRHADAAEVLRRGGPLERLRVFAAATEEPAVRGLLGQVEASAAFFQRMRQATGGFQPGRLCREHVLDLLGNATRRACEDKFDDAVARLYRAVEMAAECWIPITRISGPGQVLEIVPKPGFRPVFEATGITIPLAHAASGPSLTIGDPEGIRTPS